MTKQNKVLEALENVRKRIETEVVTFKKSDSEYEIDLYEALSIDRILLEEIYKVIEEGKRTLTEKEVKPLSRRYGRGRRKRSKRLLNTDQSFDKI